MQNILRVTDFAAQAKARLPHMAWEYLESAAGDELTLKWNVDAFNRVELLPRVLRDVSHIETSVPLFGDTLPHPILFAPIAYHKLFHPEGECETARGAALSSSVYCVSTMTNSTIEEIVQAAPQAKLWYQLYVQRDRGFTRELIERVQQAGVQALVITVDTPVLGLRIRETRAKFQLPDGLDRAMLRDLPPELLVKGHGTDLQGIYYPLVNPALTWADIEWMASAARVPVILKGILHPEDAELAASSGAAGIIVSNHGARNLDTAPAAFQALPAVVERVAGRLPVILDGGIRRGTDIFKAMASGAAAVMLGRPYIWALAANGAAGIRRCLDLLLTELKVTQALCGQPRLAELEAGLLKEAGK